MPVNVATSFSSARMSQLQDRICISWCQRQLVQVSLGIGILLLVCVSWTRTGQPRNSVSSAECSRDNPPFSFVRGQDSSMWDIVWVSPQGHRSMSVSRPFLLQAPQCPYSVWKRFSRDHCCWGRSKPGCRIVGSHTRWELTTWADFQLCLHRLLMSTGCKSSHSEWLPGCQS